MSTLDRAVVDSAAAQPRPYAVARVLLRNTGYLMLALVWGLLSALESDIGFALVALAFIGIISFFLLVVGPRRRGREEERLGGVGQPVRFRLALRNGRVPDGAEVEHWRAWLPTAVGRAREELVTVPWLWLLALPAALVPLGLDTLGADVAPWWLLLAGLAVAWPIAWWQARRDLRRLRRLAAVLDVDAS